MKNLVDLCISCKRVECGADDDILQYGNGIGDDNIICCPLYKPYLNQEMLSEKREGKLKTKK